MCDIWRKAMAYKKEANICQLAPPTYSSSGSLIGSSKTIRLHVRYAERASAQARRVRCVKYGLQSAAARWPTQRQ